ncbi:MAG: DUF503 domain-containing protein [Phycisphaeraceae bacterium]|nr:MAG: DUF503 domain-containing protein [Phycisphaeraceae bacterium]
MLIGVLQFELLIHGSTSLKDKRRVIRSVKDRLHREHMVSIAEVSALDSPVVAVMGLVMVSNSAAQIGTVMDKIIHKLRSLHDAELSHVSRQVLHGSQVDPETVGVDDEMPEAAAIFGDIDKHIGDEIEESDR